MKKLVTSIMALTVCLGLFVGCTTSNNTTTSAPKSNESQAVQSSEAPSDNNAVDIAVVAISATESNNARYIQGLKDTAEKKGWTVTVLDANGSVDDANAAFSNFISRGADVIIDMVFPATSLATGLSVAQEKSIPVLTWGGGMADGVWYTNGSGGPVATDVVKLMCENMDGKGEILALTYHGGQVARDREVVFDEIVAKYPDIKVTKSEVNIPGYLQDGMEYTNAWMASRPEGSGNFAIWGSWDDPALGAISALKQMGRTDVKVYGENGNADALNAIREGTMTATAWQDGYGEGVAAIEAIVEMLDQGENYKKGAYELPAVVVTAENVEEFISEHPEAIENVG